MEGQERDQEWQEQAEEGGDDRRAAAAVAAAQEEEEEEEKEEEEAEEDGQDDNAKETRKWRYGPCAIFEQAKPFSVVVVVVWRSMVIWRSGERGWHVDARPWMRDRQPHALVEVGTSAINYWNTKAVLVTLPVP